MATVRATNSAQNFKYSNDRALDSSWETKLLITQTESVLDVTFPLKSVPLSRAIEIHSPRQRHPRAQQFMLLFPSLGRETRTAVRVNIYRRLLIRRGLRRK